MSQMSQVTQGCAQLVGSYKVVQKVHCVCASLSGAPMWWFDVQGVFRDTRYTPFIWCVCLVPQFDGLIAQDTHIVFLVQLSVCACLCLVSQLGGLMCHQRDSVFV